jgi:hypothetical protein
VQFARERHVSGVVAQVQLDRWPGREPSWDKASLGTCIGVGRVKHVISLEALNPVFDAGVAILNASGKVQNRCTSCRHSPDKHVGAVKLIYSESNGPFTYCKTVLAGFIRLIYSGNSWIRPQL